MKLATRHLVVPAALAFVLSLSACGGGGDDAESTASASEGSTASASAASSESTATPSEAEPAAPAESGAASDPASNPAQAGDGTAPANPAPEDMPAQTQDPAAGQDQTGQGQAGQDQSGQAPAQPGQDANGNPVTPTDGQNSPGLSPEAYSHFQAGGVCFTDVFPAGIPSQPALQEIQDFCATTDPAAWDPMDGVPNPLGMSDPVS